MPFKVIISSLCALLIAVGVWYWQSASTGSVSAGKNADAEQVVVVDSDKLNSSGLSTTAESPFSSSSSDVTGMQESVPEGTGIVQAELDNLPSGTADRSSTDAITLDVATLAQKALSDDDHELWVEKLKADSSLFQQLLDEFRQEVNPERRQRLARFLGEVGGPDVTEAASELIYSGDAQSRRLGLSLLRQVQPGNSQAVEIASSLLANEVEPTVLVDTLTSLSSPDAIDKQSREIISSQVAFLAKHEDVDVRSTSLAVLSRWNGDQQYTPVLLDALQDSVPVVRESAAYALVGYANPSQDVIDSLLAVAVNSSENARARRGSIFALKGMSISEYQREQVGLAERELDTR